MGVSRRGTNIVVAEIDQQTLAGWRDSVPASKNLQCGAAQAGGRISNTEGPDRRTQFLVLLTVSVRR